MLNIERENTAPLPLHVEAIAQMPADAAETAAASAQPPHGDITPELLSVEQAAALCGMGRATFYGHDSAGRIGPVPRRFGRSVKFSRTELLAWIADGCRPRSAWRVRQHTAATRAKLNGLRQCDTR